MAQDLRGIENQLQRHEGLELELTGMEQQVSKLLVLSPGISQALQPGPFVLPIGPVMHGRALPKKFQD